MRSLTAPLHVPLPAPGIGREADPGDLTGNEAAALPGAILSPGSAAGGGAITPLAQQSPTATAQLIATQLAAAAARAGQRETEIAISPEELGRVRMRVRALDGAVHVAFLVDRPETLDMMRRHAGQLEQEFRDQGYAEVTFSFEQTGGDTGQSDRAHDPTGRQTGPETRSARHPDHAALPDAAPPALHRAAASGHLDLRL